MAAYGFAAGAICHADDALPGGFVMGSGQYSTVRGAPWNTDNFDGIASRQAEASVLLEGEAAGFTYRARADEYVANAPNHEAHYIGNLAEFNRVFKLNDDVSLSLGKRLYSLDQSYVLQPLGFFQAQTNLSDPTDTLGESQGLPMAILSWTGARASLAAVYSKDYGHQPDGFNRGIEQSLLKAGYEFDNLSTAIVVRRATGESTGIGFTASGSISDSFSWYTSAYRTHGTLRPILASLLRPGTTLPYEVLGSFRANDGVAYPRAALGMIVTPQNWPKLQLEYSYDKRGLDKDQFQQFAALGQIAAGPAGSNLAQINRAIASGMLTTQGIRQRYLSLTVSNTVGAWDLSGGVYASTEDWSAVDYVNVDYAVSPHWKASLSIMYQGGRPDSEREIEPLSSNIILRLRRLF